MKIVNAFVLFMLLCINSNAQQQDEERKGFQKDQLFVGTGINLGFFNGLILGLNPEVGYSFNRFIDVGVAVNLNYITQNDVNSPTVFRRFAYGGGPYVRIWPVNMIFIGGQFEYNQIKYSIKANNVISNRETYQAPSLLVGGGYGNRLIGQSQFYTSIMFDLLRNPNSPYIDSYGRLTPVFRTTFTFYLRPKNQRQ